MSKKYIYILVASIFVFSSCEKIIDVKLKDADPKIVVEGQVTNEVGNNFVLLTKTSSFYSSEPSDKISGAIVEISDEIGNKFILDEVSPGLYNNKFLAVVDNQKYNLHVDTGTDILESFSETSSPVKIDSIKIEINEFGPKNKGGKGDEELHYKITTYFLDKADEINYYRLRLMINGEYISGFYVIDDTFFNGKTIPYNFGGVVIEDGDEVLVELLGIDEANYNYFYTLQRLDGSGQDITPGNPPTNIEGDAIGIFGASTFDSFTEVFHVEDWVNMLLFL